MRSPTCCRRSTRAPPEMSDRVTKVESFIVSIPRDVPYLGTLRAGEAVNAQGYFVRGGNRTVYPTTDMSVLVRIETANGAVGWGEAFGVIVPRVVKALIDELLAAFVIGRDPREVERIHDDLYDLMRVRGHSGGYYLDALAGLDIALWDLRAKLQGQSLAAAIGGGGRTRLPAYVSGLPKPTLAERVDLAREWIGRGFDAIKFAAVVADDGEETELGALRAALGPSVKLMVDLHWRYEPAAAIDLIRRLQPHGLYFAEAPCAPEDVDGLAAVAAAVDAPIAVGEEWRTIHDLTPRLAKGCMRIVQPEMGHTGVTQFLRIARAAGAAGCAVIPHATIGTGLFLAASVQAAAALPNAPYHEYQHSIFDKNRRFIAGDLACAAGHFAVPAGPGLGVEPADAVWQHVVP